MKVEFKKAKLLKDDAGMVLDIWGKDDAGGSFKYPGGEIKAPVHDDIKLIFCKLRIHYAMLSARVSQKSYKNLEDVPEEVLEPYTVSTVHLNGKEDDPGFQLSGKVVLDGYAHNSTTPFRTFEEAEKDYKHIDALNALLDRLKVELQAFYEGSKRGQEKQGKLNFDGDTSKTTVNVLPEEKPLFKEPSPESVAADIVNEVNNGIQDAEVEEAAPEKKRPGRPKRVAQSPDNKSGVVSE